MFYSFGLNYFLDIGHLYLCQPLGVTCFFMNSEHLIVGIKLWASLLIMRHGISKSVVLHVHN